MKNLAGLLFLLLPILGFSQNQEGIITFEKEVKFQIELPEGMEHMKDKLPSSQKSQNELLFNASSSLWRNAAAEENEDAATFEDTNGGATFKFKMISASSNSELFKDIEARQKIEKTDFLGKVFLINGELKTFAWKLTGEHKTIAGYDCQQAVNQDTTQQVEAWFTAQIPVSTGPEEFGALPGMILEVSIDEGQTLITATNISLTPLEKDAISAPQKGKKVTQEEFDAIVEAKTKEMGGENGGENVMRIHIRQ